MSPEAGRGIWNNSECAQCGACCYEWKKWLFEIEARKTSRCENFSIKDGKAYCSAHDGKRESTCETYFCGKTESCFRYDGDEKLRKIAKMLGTVPTEQ